jgi:hypothetical protein
MQVNIGEPDFPRPYRFRKVTKWYELVAALRDNPLGWWVNVGLDQVPGTTAAAKQTSAVRAAKRYLKQPVQAQIEQQRLYVRRVANPSVPCVAQPIDWTNERPARRRQARQRPGMVSRQQIGRIPKC